MKKLTLLISFALLACVSCTDNTAALQEKITTLEKQNAAQKQQIATLAVTGYVMAQNLNHFDHSGLWNFFDAPEFWEKTYDVDPSAQCYSKCANFYSIANSACQKITDSVKRMACVQEAYNNLIACTGACR
ncbi:hypothetical protein I5907_11610 [Panacibacter sp. DH6]|uniref:Uncharacterized protein n=1 Tax=Panacibacter microcysteis TaxID=2793269 RepID=A0A931GYN2_9BACT|nr:hypothetical protein [Panacibacter microcysteis]MBG9376887.1 hypothetical protein [Panacibacter microcysteis]